jgi:hypothetical protein
VPKLNEWDIFCEPFEDLEPLVVHRAGGCDDPGNPVLAENFEDAGRALRIAVGAALD